MTEESKQVEELERLAKEAEFNQQEQAIEGEWQQAEPEAAAGLNTADIIAPLLKVTFGMMASIKGQHWAISDEVATEAAAEYAKCLDYYFPEMNAAPWVGAAVTTGLILAPRVIEDNRIKQQESEAKPDGEKEAVNNGD